MKRRHFLGTTLAAWIASPARGAEGKVPHILLRNGWQSINIGDIAHQMGMLELLETHLPEVKISFWASKLDHGVEELVKSRFPKVLLVKGPQAIARAFQDCDFFLHGSGSGFVAQTDVARWRAETKKPYGVFGISFFENNPEGVEILNNAEDCKRIAPTILALAKDPAAAKAKAAAARAFVRGRQVDDMKTLGQHLRQPANS